jgi:hypothetical protein
MSLSERVAKLYEAKRLGRRVAQLFRQRFSMSMEEAKVTLGFPRNSDPSSDEVQRAFRQRYIDNRKLHPDRGGDPAIAVALNVARDTLINPETHADNYRIRRPKPPGGWQERDHYRPNEEPVPPPPGVPFQAAVPTNVDWKILSSQTSKRDYVIEEGKRDPDGRQSGYWDIVDAWVLIGVTSNGYVFLDLKRNSRVRGTGSLSARKTLVSAWSSEKTSAPLKSDLLKIGPKNVKKIRGDFPRRAKFMVLETKLSEAMVEKARPTLSFKAAAIGSGLAPAEKGRKAQVELEPVLDRARWKSMVREERARDSHLAYYWFVYVNGRKTQLDEKEVQKMKKNYLLFALYGYDYSKKVNLTRLRGGTMKLDGKTAIGLLADAMNPGSLKDQLEEISKAL